MNAYGTELILDMYDCNPKMFSRVAITDFFNHLVFLLKMEKGDLHFWDDVGVPEEDRQTDPKTVGTSAIQFILTSNITIHTLDLRKEVYINIFSCKEFNADIATLFCKEFFEAGEVVARSVWRGRGRP